MYGLHLKEHGVGKLAVNFIDRMKFIANTGSAKKNWRGFTQKLDAFEGQAEF